ncbi:aspartic peptidase domain-containing protein [Yarrowia lipolytica]|uniref:YALI0D10967p n=1 Tax=Yarrowia lipolytica (strain CLIB 122 / E 150) TaxID=284591 RepID=Q6C9I4_YARLI|nr:YALI0D10967p [Yarrowia lipolytica CLIB122]KAB8283043.1 aspartic peptidase domain-containing protein [Yarrowia lipolytica]KAE8172395.1 aspartic peptidase domain-containing protein [Yarrowia lipolytica]KAJ8054530.1 aspartic peptidase domain-containing protein [Yarrowia lipolytica]RDW39096.1 aspartic peptidase domain-containing protein [Yarrowia lipolytica]RDW48454.1 aspartic peptidase domain-containing protein [Yarrowia lipolytica]|eukprot:XP_502678.1 YALI0D10967p [Yarrowia lipolytica CLIB122]
MRFSITAAATFVAYALAAPIAAPEAESSPADGVLAISLAHDAPLEASKIPNFAAGDNVISIEMINEVMSYYVNIELGGQKNKVHIDTGSQFLWVWNSQSQTCQSDQYKDQCATDGSYDPRKSSTSKDLGSTFHLQYGKGHADGEYYSDTAAVGAAKVNKLKFGVSPDYVNDGGFGTVFGIGPNPDNDSSFTKQLVNDGVTKRQVYGMSFGEPGDQSTSEITFGSINTGRFEGNLEKLPIKNDGHFTVKGSGKIGDTQFISNGDIILDSGTSITFLESQSYNSFIDVVRKSGIQLYPQGRGLNAFLCSDASKAPDTTFTFGNKEIKISLREFSIQASVISSQNSASVCLLGVALGDGSMNLFGDTFLRSVYSVYDLERSEVHIAQAKRGQSNNYKVVTGDVPSN